MRMEERLKMVDVKVGRSTSLWQSKVEEEDRLCKIIEWNPDEQQGRGGNYRLRESEAKDVTAHHEMSHSATYSTATIQPRTLQYISHRSMSCSEAGR